MMMMMMMKKKLEVANKDHSGFDRRAAIAIY